MKKTCLEFMLNGRPTRVEGLSPNTTLLEFLRARGQTGSKEGCAEGDCGACSVAVLERNSDGKPVFRCVNSCLIPLGLVAGKNVITVEGLAQGSLHPVQESMVKEFGSQCGYCTPGIVMSLLEGFYRRGLRTTEQIDDQLCGNLCRCTGYRPIRAAAKAAFDQPSPAGDHFAQQLGMPAPILAETTFQSGTEKFFRPTRLKNLFALMQKHPEAVLIAGATELGLEITKRYRRFQTLISLEAIPELTEIALDESEWRIGAAATLTQVEETVAREFSDLAKMLTVFGSRQIRNRATLGGNLVNASPIGDSALVLIAREAKVVLASAEDERVLPLEEFFVSYRKTALRPGEILKTILVPRSAGNELRLREFYKVTKRREMDISTVAAAFAVDLDSANRVVAARLVYGGVAATTVRARKAEAALLNLPWSPASVASALPILREEFTPISDARGSSEFRRGMIISLFEKFFAETTDQATAAGETFEQPPPARDSRPRCEPHESAHNHVTGAAIYADDEASRRGMLEVWPVCSPHAHARILKREASEARAMPGVRAVFLAEDVPGLNDVGTKRDEPLFAVDVVKFHGQLVALVVGESIAACRAAAARVQVDYEPLPAILSIAEAIEHNSFHNEPNFIRRGDVKAGLANAPEKLTGEFSLGGQEHFYLEMQAAWAAPGESGSTFVMSSTQHPSEVQAVVAHVLGVACHKVVVQCPRMGGGFGGKETQAATPAALAALAAKVAGAPVRVRFNRDQDMMLTGKRHPFHAKFEVGFDANGMLLALKAQLISNGGWALDLSQAVTDRALFHIDNCYYIPHVEVSGRVAKTNLVSNTAFRGFGGPQGMLIIEEIMDRVSRRLGLPPERVRERNLYRGKGETNTTHYGQEIEDNRIETIWRELKGSAEFEARRSQISRWNGAHPHRKRGIAITPVKFGISFTVTHLNQAGALVLIYQDGTVQVNHGGTEMGQGLHTNVRAIAAGELGLPQDRIRVMPTQTDKVPNTSATAASAGTDLNGAAVKNACETLRARLAPVAAQLLEELVTPASEPDLTRGSPPDDEQTVKDSKQLQVVPVPPLRFENGFVFHKSWPSRRVSFADVIKKAYLERVSLSATGFYVTPGIHWDRQAGRGKPFHYFANGAAISEVEIDGFTGMSRVRRVDVLQDVGNSINEAVNRGQVEGGFIQGMGWLTGEELIWNKEGVLLTHSPDTYKIPAIGDTPAIFNTTFLKNAAQKNVVHGSKAVGEPPLMLAISVREAIRDAVAAFADSPREIQLASPATMEAIWMAIQRVRR